MNKSFGFPQDYLDAKQTDPKDKTKANLPQITKPPAKTQVELQLQIEQQDPLNYGFDIAASNQLSRLNWKLNRWMKTQERHLQESQKHDALKQTRQKKQEKRFGELESLLSKQLKKKVDEMREKREKWESVVDQQRSKFKEDERTLNTHMKRDMREREQWFVKTAEQKLRNEQQTAYRLSPMSKSLDLGNELKQSPAKR